MGLLHILDVPLKIIVLIYQSFQPILTGGMDTYLIIHVMSDSYVRLCFCRLIKQTRASCLTIDQLLWLFACYARYSISVLFVLYRQMHVTYRFNKLSRYAWHTYMDNIHNTLFKIHWHRNVVILTKFLSLAVPVVVNPTSSGKLSFWQLPLQVLRTISKLFPFQWVCNVGLIGIMGHSWCSQYYGCRGPGDARSQAIYLSNDPIDLYELAWWRMGSLFASMN